MGGARLIRPTLVLAAALAWWPAAAAAQRLHERVPDPHDDEGPLIEQAAEGRNPAAIRLPNTELPEPEHRAEEQPGEHTFRPLDEDSLLQDLRQFQPDLQTGTTPRLPPYHPTFTPSIAPHKRTSALDKVAPDRSLSVASPSLEQVPVGGAPDERRDLFWGSVVVRFQPNQPVPIPSVAPEARILSVRTTPSRDVRFYRDGADNFFVVSPEAGQTRLVFVTDAPASYFGASIPADVRVSEVPTGDRPNLPPAVRLAAAQVASRLGLDPSAPVSRNLTRLVSYLRSFRTEETPLRTGADPYLTLALGRRGVCRHRAFVFVVTAQGLGLPARFVSNEVHAFAEVMIPRVGWLLIDLGGEGPLTMSSDPVARHEPRAPDPFPWPPAETPPRVAPSPSEAMARAGAGGGPPDGSSGSDGSGGDRPSPDGSEDAAGREGAEGPEGSEGPEGAESPTGEEAVSAAGAPEEEEQPADPVEQPEPAPRGPVALLERRSYRVIRGDALTVAGRVIDGDGAPMPGRRVRIWIARSRGELQLLGSTLSGPDGTFRGQLAVPSTVPTGDYDVIARPEP